MPTYEYRCPNGHDFEKFFRSMSAAQEATSIVCPVCGTVALRQLSSSAGLSFKGSGFYLTDYGKNAHGRKGPPAPAGAGEGGSSGSGDSGGGESASSSGESKPSGGESKGTSSESKPSSSDGAEKGGGAKKADKPAAPASTPTKPSSGKKEE